MRQLTHKRLTAWLLTLVMALSLLSAAALADEADDGLSPPAPQEDYGYVRLVFSEGEQLDLHHGEYITECSPTAEVFGNASEDFITDGEYAALYYEGRLYHKAALDGVSINADAVLPAEDFALVPMGELAAQAPPLGAEPVALTVEGTTGGTTGGTTEGTTQETTEGTNGGTTEGTNEGTNGGTTEGTTGGTNKQQETESPLAPPVMKAPQRAAGEYPYGRVQIKFADMDSKDENRIFLEDRQYITVCQKNATVHAVEGDEHAGRDFVTKGNYIAYFYLGRLYLKGEFNGAFIDMQQVKPNGPQQYVYVTVQGNMTMSGKPCLLYANYRHIILEIPTGKTLTLNANHDTYIKYPGAIYTHYDNNGVTIRGGGTLNINYEGREGATWSEKAVYGISASVVNLGYRDYDSPTVNINMNNGGSDFNGDAVYGIRTTGTLKIKNKTQLNIEVTGRALDPETEGYSRPSSGRVNMAIRADSMELLDSASVDIISHKNVISDIYLTGEGEVLTVNTTGHLNIKNEGNIDRYQKESDGVDLRDLPLANIKAPTGASVKFEKAQGGVFIDSYARYIDQWYDKDIAGTGDPAHHWAIEGSLELGAGMYRGDHRVGDWEEVTESSSSDIIYGTAKFIYSGLGVHTVKVSRGVGMAENDASHNPTGLVKEPEFNDIYIVKQGDWLNLTAPEGKGRFLYWYDATSNENTEGGTKWKNKTQYFQNIQEDMLLVPVYDVMTKEPTLSPLRYAEGGKIFSNYSCHDLDFAYDGTGIDDSSGFRVLLVPARLPKYGEPVKYVTMLDGRYCVRFKPGTLFADANHPSAGAAYNYMSIAPGKYRIAVGDWGKGRGYWYFSEPFEFNPPVAPPYVTPKSTFFQKAGSQQVTITAERGAAIQYRLWDYTTDAWGSYRDYTGPFPVNYTADQDARIEAKATGSAEGVTTKVEYAVQPTAIPTVKYGDQVLADAGSPHAGERYYYKSMELQVEPLEGYDIYYRVGYEPHGRNGSETCGTKLGEDGKVTISDTGTEQNWVYFRARKSLPGREGEWSRTSARLTLKEVTTLPVPNVTFYDGDTKVTPDSTNTVFFHEKLTAVLSETTFWPINVEMRYSTSMVGRPVPYTVPVEYTSEGDLRVSALATLANGSSASDGSNSVLYTIRQDASHVKKMVSTGSTIKLFNPPESGKPLTADSITGSAWKYNIYVGAQCKVAAPIQQKGLPFYKWKADPDVVVFSDPHSPATTFTMPDKDFTLTAVYKALPTEGISQNTNIDLDAGKPAGKSLSLRSGPNDMFSEWRHLKYQWYEGDSASGTPLDNFDSFETGKTYTARVTITVTEGCTFADGAGVQTMTSPSNGFIRVAEGKLTRADKKSIAFDLHLLTKPELTMELAPGDTLPTAADLTAQLPGFTVTPTWQDGATTAPDSATTMTISKLEIRPVDGSCQLANCSVWINGKEHTGTYKDSTLTLTNITLPVKPEGVSVSGTVTSYGDTGENVTVTLTPASGTPLTTTVTGNSAAYSFATVPAGDYTLKVEKKGHATREYAIAVASDPVMQDVKICLLGDVDGNGSVNMVDYIKVRQHAQAVSFLTDYALACADVNGDGNVNMVDYIKVRQHAQNIALLW